MSFSIEVVNTMRFTQALMRASELTHGHQFTECLSAVTLINRCDASFISLQTLAEGWKKGGKDERTGLSAFRDDEVLSETELT